MLFNIEKMKKKRLISWAKEYKVDLPKNPDELLDVTSLNIRNKGLERIPKEIIYLPNLIEIDAEMNRLADLPWEFGSLKKLISLNLGHNRFADIPGAICRLSQIENLSFESNAIKKVPSVIANMTGLKHLNLSFNYITELPSEIGHLKHLKSLDIASNQISVLPQGFYKLYNLVSLTLWNNKFENFPEVLKELPNLTSIYAEKDIDRINLQLIKAATADNHYGVEIALMNGADINYKLKNEAGTTFTSALFEAQSEEMVRYLIDRNADVNITRPICNAQGTQTGQESFLTKKHPGEITKYLKSINLIK